MHNGECKKNFPKPLAQVTLFEVNGYPEYRRRGQHHAQLRHHLVNNSWVVPCKSVKYILKYIHKGNDCAHVEIKGNTLHHDEILQYLNARYVGPHQAMFRIMQYKMHDKSHIIICLAVHLPLQQNIYFQEGKEERVLNVNPNTTLTAWFQLNQVDADAHQYLYTEIPVHYTFDKRTKAWRRRQHAEGPTIGRLYQVQPTDPERYSLRLLLPHRRGSTSFEDIRTIEGELHDTFKGAASAMGLFQDDAEHRRCLREATVMNMPSQMRQLFATLMLFQMPAELGALFDEFKQAMSEDFVRHDQLEDPNVAFEDRHMYLCLWDIDRNLRVHGKSIRNIQFSELPQLPENYVHPQDEAEDINIVHEREKERKCLNFSTTTSFIFTTQLWRLYKLHHNKIATL